MIIPNYLHRKPSMAATAFDALSNEHPTIQEKRMLWELVLQKCLRKI